MQLVPLKLLRFFALLIAIVLPVQGMAAVMAGLCMTMGHHEAMQAADGDSHDHSSEAAAAHHEAPSSGQASEDEKFAHCGPCTACCASVSIAGPLGIALPLSISSAPHVSAQYPPPSVPLAVLDRPPLAV